MIIRTLEIARPCMNRFLCIVAFLLLATFAHGQATVQPLATGHYQFFDTNGIPLASGCLFSYISGSLTAQATYTDSTGSVQNANPTILSSSGQADIWPDVSKTYKFKLMSAGGSNCATGSTLWTVDNIPGSASHLFSADGTCSSTGLGFISEPGTGFIRSTSGVIDICLAGTDYVKVNSAALFPTTAAGLTLGKAANPFSSVYVGNAATNNVQITAGTLSQASTFTLPDVTSDTFAFLGATQTFTNKKLNAASVTVIDNGDATKTLGWSLAGMTTAKAATLTFACPLACTFTYPTATDTLVGTAATQTLLAKTLTSPTIASPTITQPTINTGVTAGSGLKHQRFGVTCSTGTTQGNSCTTTYSWTVAFADANYTVVCTPLGQVNAAAGMALESVTNTGFTVRVNNLGVGSSTNFTSVDCIAIHD